MAKFLSELIVEDLSDKISRLVKPLIYESDLLEYTVGSADPGKVAIRSRIITVPIGFETDFASVPRVPIAFWLFGNRAHRESVLHDYLYRIDSSPVVTKEVADSIFLEAMKVRNKGWWVRYPMYWGVCLGGGSAYHKRTV